MRDNDRPNAWCRQHAPPWYISWFVAWCTADRIFDLFPLFGWNARMHSWRLENEPKPANRPQQPDATYAKRKDAKTKCEKLVMTGSDMGDPAHLCTKKSAFISNFTWCKHRKCAHLKTTACINHATKWNKFQITSNRRDQTVRKKNSNKNYSTTIITMPNKLSVFCWILLFCSCKHCLSFKRFQDHTYFVCGMQQPTDVTELKMDVWFVVCCCFFWNTANLNENMWKISFDKQIPPKARAIAESIAFISQTKRQNSLEIGTFIVDLGGLTWKLNQHNIVKSKPCQF